jgi:hypothetical protein
MVLAASRAPWMVETAVDWAVLTVQGLDKKIPVFRNFQGSNRSSENLDTESLEHTHLFKLDTDIQGTLTTKCQEDTVWSFFFQYIGDIVGGDG